MGGKAFVLLSGGIDSSTCLFIALNQFDSVEAVSIDYGQRHIKEASYARMICERVGVKHSVLNLQGIVPKTMLTDSSAEVPSISYDQIKGVSPTYVPFRNGLMLSAITSYVAGKRVEAEKEVLFDGRNEWGIFFGAHAEDAQNWAYPDCTPEFIGALANAIHVGTYYGIRLHTPLEWLNKPQIIEWGEKLGVPWELTWSCYKGEEWHCGVCPTCRARQEGFRRANVKDPTEYSPNAFEENPLATAGEEVPGTSEESIWGS